MTLIGEEQDGELAREETPAERIDRNFRRHEILSSPIVPRCSGWAPWRWR